MNNKYHPSTIRHYYCELERDINERVNYAKENNMSYYIEDIIHESIDSMMAIYHSDIISLANTLQDVDLFLGPQKHDFTKENPTAYDIITAAFYELLSTYGYEVLEND